MRSLLNNIILSRAAEVEADSLSSCIYPARSKKTSYIFKVLLTNYCSYNCSYCFNNVKSNCRRFLFKPQYLANTFINLYRKNKVGGIFLSSGIYRTEDYSQERILEAVIFLRKKMNYKGYIHAKVLPGASLSLIKELSLYADRLSVNLEFPAQKYLKKVSNKDFYSDLFTRLKYLSRLNEERCLSGGITTQFVVGAVGECDREILYLTQKLYKQLGLRRVYYSGFVPYRGSPLQDNRKADTLRIRRLYEADFLIRDYGFLASDFLYDASGNLLKDKDVKVGYALKNACLFPINVNKADFYELIRIPGIGKKRACQIINIRSGARINSFQKLEKVGISKEVRKWICY